jgi:hypothetical protein
MHVKPQMDIGNVSSTQITLSQTCHRQSLNVLIIGSLTSTTWCDILEVFVKSANAFSIATAWPRHDVAIIGKFGISGNLCPRPQDVETLATESVSINY